MAKAKQHGSSNADHADVKVIDQSIFCPTCDHDQCTHQGKVGEYKDGRDKGIRIKMECEVCGKLPDLVIYQHKGITAIAWDISDRSVWT